MNKPSKQTIQNCHNILTKLKELHLKPSSIDYSDNSILIAFSKPNNYAEIECSNERSVLAVTANSKTTVWTVKNLDETLLVLLDFLGKNEHQSS